MNALILPVRSIFYRHLFELKLRLAYVIFSLFISFLTCYYYCFEIIYIFAKPFLQYSNRFMFTNLAEAFYTSIEISFLCSLYTVIPLFLYQFWCFIIPSKFENERKKLNFTFFSIFIFFIISILFVYSIFLPKLYEFLLNFQINTNLLHIELQARIQSYVELACKIFIFFTFFFQLPLIFLSLVKHKCIKLYFLFANRKKIVLIALIISALISPADIVAQLSLTLFVVISLEILFLIAFFYEKKLAFYK